MSQVIVEKQDDIGIVIINNTTRKNTINHEIILGLKNSFAQLAEDKSVNVVILTGAGSDAFCAGMDVNWLLSVDSKEIRKVTALAQETFAYIEDFPKVVITAINGVALGAGCILALVSDIRIAAVNAKLGFPEIKLGIPNVLIGPMRLQRIVGFAKTKELMLMGDLIDANESYRIGLVNSITEPQNLMTGALTYARKIALGGPLGLELNKKAINNCPDINKHSQQQFEIEVASFYWSTDDFKEGLNAFFEKRNPVFQGK